MIRFLSILTVVLFLRSLSHAATDGSISGQVLDADGIAVPSASVELTDLAGKKIKETLSSDTGEFHFFPVEIGDYKIFARTSGGLASAELTSVAVIVHVASGATARIDINLSKSQEVVVNVEAKRSPVQATGNGSQKEIKAQQIQQLPNGDNASLPKLLSETSPGIVQGAFGQTFIRGNHANIQYQIDGVQLPDSISGTFGDAFSPKNIDRMEVITGGIPAEFGERLAAVVNIVTKSGPEKPGGEAELRFGSYNTYQPKAFYGGTDGSGKLRYYVSAGYMQTDRGLDTPQPASYSDQAHGGLDAVHDQANTNDQYVRIDDQLSNTDSITLNAFTAYRFYQIPNFPASFNQGDPYFGPNFVDQFNDPAGSNNWAPSTTGDTQTTRDTYFELAWKHTLSEKSFLFISPFYKRSDYKFNNDPSNDLAAGSQNPTSLASFSADRSVNNFGLKIDHTWRLNPQHLIKSGVQSIESRSAGGFTLQVTSLANPVTSFGTPDRGNLQAAYVEDNYSFAENWTLNYGLRATGIQYSSDQITSQDGLLQPRINLEWIAIPSTKLHVFYGKLFMPAPFESLHDAFVLNGFGSTASAYDVKAEKDDYYETGVEQQFAGHTFSATYYYKSAVNQLDESQLYNTPVAQPYNYAQGYATGVEFSMNGAISSHLSDFLNYSYEDARGQNISGGAFAIQQSNFPPNNINLFLDHVQLNTANAGLTYKTDDYFATLLGLYGSGLRAGPFNASSLPEHLTFDFSLGYEQKSSNWWNRWKLAGDVTNITNFSYPINIANGFNGNHYAAGREYFIRFSKEL